VNARAAKGRKEPPRRTTPVELSDAHTTPRTALLTPAELAQRWSVRQQQVWRLAREGGLPVVRIGRYMRFRLADIERWEANGGSSG
jgi:excisionase family DNA binding protein